ncbi:MAG: xanthine dehydrogenase family protein subunit M [Verrucomicrobiaceae bacterium]|nr:MAG: xanthine dehydrogenase family protein subunit M [Verrucomicrobiaceae bacterium]
MKPFNYFPATDLSSAVRELSSHASAMVIAGGTNLVDLMKEHVLTPMEVVDITRLAMGEIREMEDGGVSLGALATNADTARHPLVSERYPLLASAILAGASPQLRNRATDGGNLLQRTRCPYFYDSALPCNKRLPGSGCPAREGYNRMHAILGASEECVATHPSDMCVALAALGATVVLEGVDGARRVPFHDFHLLPGEHPERETVMNPGEVITSIELPSSPFARHSHYLKIRDRRSYAFALVSVAVGLEIEGGIIRSAGIALGGVAHKPWRRQAAEDLLAGQKPSRETFSGVADALLAGAVPLPFNSFKIPLTRDAIVRALAEAAGNPSL